jgi:hypothetical protein
MKPSEPTWEGLFHEESVYLIDSPSYSPSLRRKREKRVSSVGVLGHEG